MTDDLRNKSSKVAIPDSVFSSIGCISLHDGYAKINYDLSLYDIESIYSATYSLLDDSYFFFEGNSKVLTVVVIPKSDSDVKRHVLELNNRVINYSFYKIKSIENKSMKEIILAKALFRGAEPADSSTSSAADAIARAMEEAVSDCACSTTEDCGCESGEEISEEELQSMSNLSYASEKAQAVPQKNEPVAESKQESFDDFDFDDLEDISIPWEEKHDSKVIDEERKKLESFFKKSSGENGKTN